MSTLVGARVLLVEDHVALAENVTEILEDEGATVVHAASGSTALELANESFDVALVDVRLPDVTGLELLGWLRTRGDGEAEMILMTGNATIDDAVAAVSAGAYAYILKPFDAAELVGHVERAVRQVAASRRARRLGAEVERREAALRTLVDTVQALLLVLDSEGRVVLANPAVAATTGIPAEELVGVRWLDELVPEEDRAAVTGVFARLLAGETRVPHENRVCRRDGTTRIVSWQSSPYEADGGAVLVYASGLDVTDIKELEARSRLAERLAAVGTLSAGLAHEIRNPLNSARLQLHLLQRRLQRRDLNGELTEPVDLVQTEIDRLSKLVGDFLEFARPVDLDIADADLTAIAERVIELERPVAVKDGVELRLTRPPSDIRLCVDADKIGQVLLNLIRNALEAVGRGGTVEVEVVSNGNGGARLVVRDDGPGIPPDVAARLFEPFFSTKASGTGLGMAICHSVVSQHGGTISVGSNGGANGGSGAELTIDLPPRPPSPRRITTLEARAKEPS